MELGPAIASARAAMELLSIAVKARDDSKVQAATLDLREKLFAMSDIAMGFIEKNAALVTENAALKLANAQHLQAKAEVEDRLRERENYVPHEIRPGALVYAYQPRMQGNAAPAHYLCQACYDKGTKSVLQFSPARPSQDARWLCPEQTSHHITAHGTALSSTSSGRVIR
jgi:hypothetical protein